MASASVQEVTRCLQLLLTSYADDSDATGTLKGIQDSHNEYLSILPETLLHDIKMLLHLLVDVKADNAQLWQEAVVLRDRLEVLEQKNKEVERCNTQLASKLQEVERCNTQLAGKLQHVQGELRGVQGQLQMSQEKLAFRQMLHV